MLFDPDAEEIDPDLEEFEADFKQFPELRQHLWDTDVFFGCAYMVFVIKIVNWWQKVKPSNNKDNFRVSFTGILKLF